MPQDSIGRILFMFLWPAIWYTFLIYGVAARAIPEGATVPTWMMLSIVVLGPGAEMLVGLIGLRNEGYALRLATLRERIRWRWPKGRRAWTLAVVVLVLAMAGSEWMGAFHAKLAHTPGFIPPDWWPALSDPRVEAESMADIFPDVEMQGNYLFVLMYTFISVVFNIFGEGIYYHGYLLPRMRGAFGRWDWVANGVLFMLKHVYQRWLYPGILVGSLAFAFAAGPMGSLPLSMLFHWIGNDLFAMIYMIGAVLGLV